MEHTQHWQVVNYGQQKQIVTPEDLWFMACSYFKWCDEHPIKTKKPVISGKEVGTDVNVTYIRPYNIKGLCLHCGLVEEYIRDLRNLKDSDSMWYHVASRILYIIYLQNMEMATVGEYNAVFVSRLYRIDNEEVPSGNIKIELVGDLPKLSNSETEILEKMELEKPLFEGG